MLKQDTDEGALSLDKVCRYTPFVILAYFAVHYLLRVIFSTNLEVDEAQFVGSVDLQLLYGNSHPPLYNWLVRLFLEVTGWNWHIALPLLKNMLLAGTYILGFDLVYRVTGNHRSAALSLVGLLLMPQILWQSQITLAHSVMVAFGVVATLHALVMVMTTKSWLSHIWLAVALAIGALSKFNFFLFVLAFAISYYIHAYGRRSINIGKSLVTLALYIAFTAPSKVAAVLNIDQSAGRMKKLYRDTLLEKWIDLPYLGIDGLVSFFSAGLASVGLVLLAFYAAYRFNSKDISGEIDPGRALFANLFLTTVYAGLTIFALIVLFADMHHVHERYLTPLLVVVPFAIVLKWPLERSLTASRHLLKLGMFMMCLCLIGVNSVIMMGSHALAYPYKEFALGLERKFGSDVSIVAARHMDGANIMLKMPEAKLYDGTGNPAKIILVWRKKHESSREGFIARFKGAYDVSGEVFRQEQHYYFFPMKRKTAVLSAQLLVLRP